MKRIYITLSAASLCLLVLVSVTSYLSVKRIRTMSNKLEEKQTEYVFVYRDDETESTTIDTSDKWIVREYEERIGIFDSEGQLYDVIDTYTKTLPEKDRSLLKEGIEITDPKDLYSIIEAYSD